MKVQIIAIGKIKENYLKEGIAEFVKRLKPYCTLTITECSEEKMPDNPSVADKTTALFKEGERLIKAIRKDDFVIVLDVVGKAISSEKLAQLLQEKALSGKSNISIVIGGAYGLGDNICQKADVRLSFSALTFTHQMIRFLLVEQIYRAFKIINNEKYHN